MFHSLKPSILSALVLTFASLGDAFLYTALPVNAPQLNVPGAWIGFLLSINRFVRMVANQMFAYLFGMFGFRRITILMAIAATLTTFSYGTAIGISVWVISRIVWGFCFSALRISSVSYSLETKSQSFSLGLSKGLHEVGPIIALLAGPWLMQQTNVSTTFFIFGLVSVFSVVISLFLPELKATTFEYRFSFNIIPSSFNLLTFLTAFFVHGILIVTITGILFNPNISIQELSTVAGIYLVYRRICSVFISPVSGLLAERFGLRKVYSMALISTITGLFLIAVGYTTAGIIIAFTFNSIATALAPGNAVSNDVNNLNSVTTNSTWNDMGAATGALCGGAVLLTGYLNDIFLIGTFVLLAAFIIYIKSINFKAKEFIKWN